MGLFGSILGELGASDTQHAALFSEVGTLVNDAGGVAGLAQQFEQNGLGGAMSAWISKEASNPAVTSDQIIQVLGKDRITAIAGKAGLSEDQVAAGISKLLPLVVDHLTPGGAVPPHSPDAVNAAMDTLKDKLAGAPPPAE